MCVAQHLLFKAKTGKSPFFLLSFDLGNPESESPELHGTFTLNELALLWSWCLIGFSCISYGLSTGVKEAKKGTDVQS